MGLICERRGQLEIGIVDHEGRSYAAFGASVNGGNESERQPGARIAHPGSASGGVLRSITTR